RNMHLASTSPVDQAFEQNLKEIDDFIADCERHLKEVPQDELAREYLYSAYQQKAEVPAAMLDRGSSVSYHGHQLDGPDDHASSAGRRFARLCIACRRYQAG